jgi:dienelactone hydrolase
MRTLLALGMLSIGISVSHAQPAAELPHARLLVYRDAAGREQPVKTAADWQQRRAAILAGMQEAMGKMPGPDAKVPLDMQQSGETFEGEGYYRLTISYAAEKNDRVPAYLYLPKSPPGIKLPAMLALHPTSPLGKDVVDDKGPRPNRGYAKELAERGYVVLAPDYPSFGDYKSYDFNSDDYVSGTMKGIWNHLRGVDLLASLKEVDPERIGVIGHSLGGHNAMFVGVFDERLKVIVSSCGWTPFHDYYGGKIAGWTSDRYMPKLKTDYDLDPDRVPFDFYEVVAALAPRAFFSCSPVSDSNFDVAGVRKAIPLARQVYQLLGAAENLQVRYPDSEHDFPTPTRRESYQFIDKVLNHKPAKELPDD